MTATTTIRRDVQDLKRALLPKPPASFIVAFPWNPDQPHGRYGYQTITTTTPLSHDTVDPETELAFMREHYDSIPKYAKRLQNGPGECGVDWRTFETYLKGHECKCGRFGHG